HEREGHRAACAPRGPRTRAGLGRDLPGVAVRTVHLGSHARGRRRELATTHPHESTGDHRARPDGPRPLRAVTETIAPELPIDLLAGDFYVNNPYPTYAWMREHAPAYWDPINELWGISRHDDIVDIEKQKDLFVSSDKAKGGYRPNIPADRSLIGL